MEWKDMVDLQRELVKMGAKLSIVQRENARLKEELAKKEHDYRLLGEYYECAIQREDELADLMWEKEEEIEKYQDKLVEASEKIQELEVERDLANLRMCQAEGKLDKVDNYLRIVYGEGVDRYGKY